MDAPPAGPGRRRGTACAPPGGGPAGARPRAGRPLRGHLSDDAVARLLETESPAGVVLDHDALRQLEDEAAVAEAAGADVRLRRLAVEADLTALDTELLVIALLPDLDSRFERLYGYLNDDVTRRRASVGLALQLAGVGELDGDARSRLEAQPPPRPARAGGGRGSGATAAHPWTAGARPGGGSPARRRRTGSRPQRVAGRADRVPVPAADQLAVALEKGVGLVYLGDRGAGTAPAAAVAALAITGRSAVTLDLTRLIRAADPVRLVGLAVREAVLRGAGLVAWPVEAVSAHQPEVVSALAEADARVLLCGSVTWDPLWSSRHPIMVEAPTPIGEDRAALWRRELDQAGTLAPGLDVARLVGHLGLGPTQIQRAARTAAATAWLRDGTIGAGDLRRGVRAQNAAGLERLARRTEPECRLGRPGAHSRRAPGSGRPGRPRAAPGPGPHPWRMRRGGGRGRGVTALFAGPTPAPARPCRAEVVAGDLGVDLYTSTWPPWSTSTSARPRRTWSGSSPRPRAVERRAVLRRGGRDLRQAQRGQGRSRPLRQHRGRVPAAAARSPSTAWRCWPPTCAQHRRRVRASARRHHRLPGADGGAAALPVEPLPRRPTAGRRRSRPDVPGGLVRAGRRQHPLRGHLGRVPGGGARCPGRHAAGRGRRRAGVPKAGAPRAGAGVRALLRRADAISQHRFEERADSAASARPARTDTRCRSRWSAAAHCSPCSGWPATAP